MTHQGTWVRVTWHSRRVVEHERGVQGYLYADLYVYGTCIVITTWRFWG